MADQIFLLPDAVVNQIAAGEVIQRPASVVKELLDNAIDAQASQIKLIVQDAGKSLIQVNDNGIGMSATDAKVEALRQQMEVRDYNERVAESQLTLGSESLRVMQDFPIFNPDNPSYDQELAAEAADLMEANLIRDPNVPEIDPATGEPTGKGLIIGSNVSPYRFYQTLYRASSISAAKGQIKGQQAQQEQLANADTPGSIAPPKKASDPVLDIWNDES